MAGALGRASAAPASPVHGGQDPAVAPAQGTGQPPPRRHSGEGRAPRTCPAGREAHGPGLPPQPRRPVPETGTLGVGSVPCCSGTALEPLLSGHHQAQDGEWGPPSPPGERWQARSVSSRGAVVWQVQVKQVHSGGTAAAGGTSPAGTGGCQASEGFSSNGLALVANFTLGREK